MSKRPSRDPWDEIEKDVRRLRYSNARSPGERKRLRAVVGAMAGTVVLTQKTDPRMRAAALLVENWLDLWRVVCANERWPCDEADPNHAARVQRWYRAFCGLLRAEEVPPDIERALRRANLLRYPLAGPAPFTACYDRLVDPQRYMRPWGEGDFVKNELPQLQEAGKTALADWQAQVAADVEALKNDPRYETLDWL